MRSLVSASPTRQPCTEIDDSVTDLHRNCFACGQGEDSLGLTFEHVDVSTVSAEWFCEEKYQSYPGIVHGGIIATILDSAMTNCLLMKGIQAVTADMHVDYRKPLRVGNRVRVKATLVRARSPLFKLSAEVVQNGVVCATAEAKFMRSDVWSEKNCV